jgi:hypothetical protein
MYYRREETLETREGEQRPPTRQDTSAETAVPPRVDKNRGADAASESREKEPVELGQVEQPQRRGWWQRPFRKA